MPLLTKSQTETLLKNGRSNRERMQEGQDPADLKPVVKLFTPDAACTWLITELDPDDPDIAFGLCDLGMGSPELGSVSLMELGAARGPFGLAVERDRYFRAEKTLMAYAREAWSRGRIVA